MKEKGAREAQENPLEEPDIPVIMMNAERLGASGKRQGPQFSYALLQETQRKRKTQNVWKENGRKQAKQMVPSS